MSTADSQCGDWQQLMLYMLKPLYIMTLVDESVITVLC